GFVRLRRDAIGAPPNGTKLGPDACIGWDARKGIWMVSGERIFVTADSDFAAFYDLWRPPLHRALALAVGSRSLADEAVDEAMTRALAQWEKIRDYDRPEGWVYRVGLNWARGVFRKRRYEILADVDFDTRRVDVPLPDTDVIDAVGRLSYRLRSVVVARYYLDWSTAEVAAALGIPEGTVKSRLSRALSRLGKELGGTS
ncbi:MAG: sigma-70 family RNA polymerase sigma factor, partial [Acidimicrobiia bacterium]